MSVSTPTSEVDLINYIKSSLGIDIHTVEMSDDQYDIDDGLYIIGELSREKRPTPKAFHDWIIKLIEAPKNYHERV